jgi:malate permease and related proteins
LPGFGFYWDRNKVLGTLLQMFGLLGIGLLWSWWNPARVDTDSGRRVLSDAVYYLFLPALVLQVLWRAPLGLDSLKISVSATSGVLTALLASLLVCRTCRVPRPVTGAILLAASWPNATYLGLPVLEQTFGPWARGVAIQYDLFACTPLLLTVGIWIASRFGDRGQTPQPLWNLLRVPPLWAALLAVAFNLAGVALPGWLDGFLGLLAAAVVPLMLISGGMALRQGFSQWRRLPLVLPVVVIQLLVMPLFVWGATAGVGLTGDMRSAVVLEAAMPTMALGVVLCDRYGLNTGVYAAALTVTTLLSLLTLPLWFQWVGWAG